MNINAFAKTLKVGSVCNVRSPKYTRLYGPVNRVVTKFGFEKKKDGKWFYWYWKKEGQFEGKPDCGYSGVLVDG